MSFIPPVALDSWQAVAQATALHDARSERREAIGNPGPAIPSPGTSAQSRAFWLSLQQWLESYCTWFVNDKYDGDPSEGRFDNLVSDGVIPDGVIHTKATWQASAGLHEDDTAGWSFRRLVTYDNTKEWTEQAFLYGFIQVGDIIGPWIVDDLQKGYDALRWTAWNGDDFGVYPPSLLHSEHIDIGSLYAEASTSPADCSTARANCETEWGDAVLAGWTDPGSVTPPIETWAQSSLNPYDVGVWYWYAHRHRARAYISGLPTHVAAGWDLYALPEALDPPNVFHAFGLGIVENELEYISSGAPLIASSKQSALLNSLTTFPPDDCGLYCSTEAAYGFHYTRHLWVLKWSFANTL